jgi:hypothetical protein
MADTSVGVEFLGLSNFRIKLATFSESIRVRDKQRLTCLILGMHWVLSLSMVLLISAGLFGSGF